jgi:dihydrofolate reductase
MQINIIAACDRNGIIGKNGKLPWSIREDMQRFRELTLGNPVIMGRKTWDSLAVKPLDLRENIVLTSDRDTFTKSIYCLWANSLKQAIEVASYDEEYDEYPKEFAPSKAFIIGGERLYTEALPLADRVYLTLVDTEVEVGPEDTVARFPLEQMKALFRMEMEDKRDGFSFTEWMKK